MLNNCLTPWRVTRVVTLQRVKIGILFIMPLNSIIRKPTFI